MKKNLIVELSELDDSRKTEGFVKMNQTETEPAKTKKEKEDDILKREKTKNETKEVKSSRGVSGEPYEYGGYYDIFD